MSERRGKTSHQITCSLNILCEFYICVNPIVDWPRLEMITSRKRNTEIRTLWGDWMIFFLGGGGHMVFRGTGGGLVITKIE